MLEPILKGWILSSVSYMGIGNQKETCWKNGMTRNELVLRVSENMNTWMTEQLHITLGPVKSFICSTVE